MNFKIDKIEKRVIPAEEKIEVRADGDTEKRVSGYGIVYDRETEIFPGYKERIRGGAFTKSIADTGAEIKSFFNHDPDQVLSTTRSEPALKLTENKSGVKFDSPIPPTTYGNDLIINLTRGNVKGASFAFTVNADGDVWREDGNGVIHREITSATLYEVGPVTNPAYTQSSAALRSAESAVEEYRSTEAAEKNKRQVQMNAADLQIKKMIVQALEKTI